jgi:ribosomal protein S18 acetylase RimI-like enzyme
VTDLFRIERAAESSVPSAGFQQLGRWRVHMSDGYVRRLNSVALHGEHTDDDETRLRLETVRRLYGEQRLRPLIRETTMDEWISPFLVDWPESGETIVMTAAATGGTVGPAGTIEDWLAWLQPRAALHARFAEAAASARRLPTDNVVLFATQGRNIVGAGRGVSIDGLTGLYDITVDPEYRRRGHGRALLRRLSAWAAERSDLLYLQVAAVNTTAIQLYETEGFVERYRYRYRRHG